MNNLIEVIDQFIVPARRFLLITHVMPDGDAFGSLLGLGALLRGLGKEVTLACQDPAPEILTWLPGVQEVVTQPARLAHDYDRVVSLDCSDRRRLGRVYLDRFAALPLLNVDHHVTNTEFGTLNWVDPAAVATAQMVLELADTLGWQVTEPVATCLLTGLVTDTRSFRTPNVGAPALCAGLRLIEAGASLAEVTRRTLGQHPLAWVRVLGQAIDDLSLEDGILSTEVTVAMRRQWSLSDEGTSGITNFLSGVREADVVVVFTERDDGTIDVSMRAVPGINVAQVALKLGGGGHPQASGCTLPGDLHQVRDHVLDEVRRSLADQQRQRDLASEAGGPVEVKANA